MPEARRADGVHVLVAPVDHRADELDHLVRVRALVALQLQLVDRLAALVEALRTHRGRADVERQHAHFG